MNSKRSCVVVFAKSPRAGRVKTRLVPPLSPHEAAELHRACLLGTLRVVLSMPGNVTKAIYWSGHRAIAVPRSLRRKIEMQSQRGADLGARMSNAMRELLGRRGFGAAVIIGGDHPTLPRKHVLQALGALRCADVVLGPSKDGGYYLVGCRRWIPEMFRRIPWGTARVFRATSTRLKQLRVPFSVLPQWYDIDRPRDLTTLRRELARRPKDSIYPSELKALLEGLDTEARRSSHRRQRRRRSRKRPLARA